MVLILFITSANTQKRKKKLKVTEYSNINTITKYMNNYVFENYCYFKIKYLR